MTIVFFTRFFASVTMNKGRCFISCSTPGHVRKKGGDACRTSTRPLVPFSPTLIRLSLLLTRPARSLLAGNSIHFPGPRFLPPREEIITAGNIFFCGILKFSSVSSSAPDFDHSGGFFFKKKERETETERKRSVSDALFLRAVFFSSDGKSPDVT